LTCLIKGKPAITNETFSKRGQMSTKEYVLGHSDAEIKRLIFQSELLRPITARMLLAAQTGSGMRVLDIGCGVGGVSSLAADLVGPDGFVVGIDQSEKAIEVASTLLRKMHVSNVEFRHCSFEDFSDDSGFDLVVGRYVLLFQNDAVSFLKKAAELVRPGGYIAFHEVDDGRQFQSVPKVELWDLVVEELLTRLQRGCPQYDIAQRMVHAFSSASLPDPKMFYEIPVGGGSAAELCTWATETLRSLSADPTKTTLPDGRTVNMNSLEVELRDAISTAHAQVEFLGQACAWAQL
jgi:2-polyprenyl-3-methyl-5-hydroxy-6-metoxy-1,4-benzoquinol methylase